MMRQNTVTYWTKADCANRETCPFVRLNDAFRKPLLQAARKKFRKLTDHGKQLLPRALISNVIVSYDTKRIMGNNMWGRGRRVGKNVNSIKNTFFCLFDFCLLQLVRAIFY